MKKATIGVLIALAMIIGLTPLVQADVVRTKDTPVLWLHGVINSTGCPGIKTATQAAPFSKVLKANGYTGSVIGMDYLCGDNTGVDIKPYAPYAKSTYNVNMPIENIALAFANYVYSQYSSKGLYVNIAAHSMGGLISSYAVKASGTVNGFPPYLLVRDAVTFSTPYGGLDEAPAPFTPTQYVRLATVCGNYTQCNEMIPGSAFLTGLKAMQFPGGIDWTTIGGSPKDIMSYASSSNTDAAHKVNYYGTTPVNYGHSAYITDTSNAEDAPVKIDNYGVVTTVLKGSHSLKRGYLAFSSANY